VPLLIWPRHRHQAELGRAAQGGRFRSPLIFSNSAMFIVNFSDRFFLQRLRSLDVVGVYAAGYRFGFLLNLMFNQALFLSSKTGMIGKRCAAAVDPGKLMLLSFQVTQWMTRVFSSEEMATLDSRRVNVIEAANRVARPA
jgi:hypothetical protein